MACLIYSPTAAGVVCPAGHRGSLLLPLRHLRQTLSQLAEYTRTPYYGMMISGLLAILVFSRLFGMHGLWYAVLEENYARVVKIRSRKAASRLAICCA